ncbi:hypothetical protein [Thermoflexibacter ruber]|uniref:DUF1648 domain-containing protein n=1 Tax=Thermoflexibacter ruber TaxID=1003 RepID=A0A1I2GDR2_9BACT|nr:hypothetical protein [Thermoflexibacter ruber]SFF15914.1 hypothetical protein SAMN04488541_101820 [Thermoflexibacter ruber]
MRRLATFFWVISLLIFLTVLVYSNVYLPNLVRVQGSGAESWFLQKSQYFYSAVAVATFINGAILLLGGAFRFIPSFLMPVPKRHLWMGDSYLRKELYLNLKAWTKGLGVCFNLVLIIGMIDVYDENETAIFIPTAWLYILVSIISLAWFVTYYFWFSHIPSTEND